MKLWQVGVQSSGSGRWKLEQVGTCPKLELHGNIEHVHAPPSLRLTTNLLHFALLLRSALSGPGPPPLVDSTLLVQSIFTFFFLLLPSLPFSPSSVIPASS